MGGTPGASAPSSATPGASDDGSLHAAWSFSGSNETKSRLSSTLAVLAALLMHAGVGLYQVESPSARLAEVAIDLETFLPAEEETPEPPAPEPEPLPEPEPPVPSNVPFVPNQQERAAVGHPHAESVDVGAPADDLAAPVVTDESGGADWAMLSGHGETLGRGGLGRPGRGATGVARTTSLSARDLSRPAAPPNLQALVDRNFPTAARMARVGGTVTVSAVIQPDGTPTDVRVVSVNPEGRGFGEACSRTVHEGPDWKPKLNRDGRPVAAKVSYTCQFELPEGVAVQADSPSTGVGANRIWGRPAGG